MASGADSGTLYLVDAHSLIFQVFHAIRGMTSPSGMPTNALFGFIRDLLFLRSLNPDYLVCAFDRSEPTFRSAIYPDYKAHRDAPPDDLLLQVPLIYRALAAMNIPALSMVGYEADDVMATIAMNASARGLDVFVCTADKDCRQLINDRVRLFNLRKREEFGRAELLADWGVKPGQVVDLQSLVGDGVDNVPGVAGIGVKTAAQLLQEFGTLENILASVDRIAGAKRQENLRAAGPVVELSRKLVRLVTDVPLTFDWDAWRVQPIDVDELLALCREWGFQSLAGQVRALGKSAPAPVAAASPTQRDLFSDGGELFPFGANAEEAAPTRAAGRRSRRPDNDGNQLEGILSAGGCAGGVRRRGRPSRAGSRVSPSIWRRPAWSRCRRTSWASPFPGRRARPITWRSRALPGAALLDKDAVLARLRPLLEDARIAKINQNIKYDLLVLRAHGVNVQGRGRRSDGGRLPAARRRTLAQHGGHGPALPVPPGHSHHRPDRQEVAQAAAVAHGSGAHRPRRRVRRRGRRRGLAAGRPARTAVERGRLRQRCGNSTTNWRCR